MDCGFEDRGSDGRVFGKNPALLKGAIDSRTPAGPYTDGLCGQRNTKLNVTCSFVGKYPCLSAALRQRRDEKSQAQEQQSRTHRVPQIVKLVTRDSSIANLSIQRWTRKGGVDYGSFRV